MSKFRLEEVTDLVAWNSFVDTSPQGTMFSNADYLKLAVDQWKVYWIKKGEEVKAGLALVFNEDCGKVVLDDLVIHNGLMFALDKEQKETKARLSRFEITEFVVELLSERYQHLELALAPQTEDLRPYLWYNYHSDVKADRFTLDLRYTSYLDISSLDGCDDEEESVLFRGLETLRQRNIREARKVGARTVVKGGGTAFVGYYESMMFAKGEDQSSDKLKRLKRLIDGLVEKRKAAVFLTQNPDGETIYASVFGWDNKRAYYLFGAPVEGRDERYKGTLAFWNAYLWLADKGVEVVDLEGINSPNRGWFKLSFGGSVQPYYQIHKDTSKKTPHKV